MRTPPRAVRRPTWLLLLLFTLLVVLQIMQSRRPAPEAGRPAARAEALRESPARAADPTGGTRFSAAIGFRSPQRLAEHYDKHGAEFGARDAAEYLARAQALRDAPVGGAVLEAVRSDGVVSRFDRHDGTFIAFDRDGTIRTCFRPNDGERYFQRQARRLASAP